MVKAKMNKIICKMRIQNELSEPFELTKEMTWHASCLT